jgi:hypothetical protein
VAKTMAGKRAGMGLEMQTFHGTKGTYIVFKLPTGAYHAFVETEAKAAAKDCGAALDANPNTRQWWDTLWDKP